MLFSSNCYFLRTNEYRAQPALEVFLPKFDETTSCIEKAAWGELKGSQIAKVSNEMYKNVVKWRKNLFKVPTGKVGQMFIEEVSKTITLFTSGSHLESVALTLVMIMFPLLLQKPSQSSKAKDHVKFLEARLVSWKAGDLTKINPNPNPNGSDRVPAHT